MSIWDFRSLDTDEVQHFLAGIYAENEFRFLSAAKPSRTRIYGGDLGDIAQYNVSYSSPFSFLSEGDRESFLILSCTAGGGRFSRGRDTIEFSAGRSGVVSATRESRVHSGGELSHISTHISTQAVNSLCSRLIGRPLDEPVLFAHSAFTDELKYHWEMVIGALGRMLDQKCESDIAISSLEAHAMTLLLEKHPHNYSLHLLKKQSVEWRTVREAKNFMDENAGKAITMTDVAAFAGCSIRALHNGFCEYAGVTPRAYLHIARMNFARILLAGGEPDRRSGEAIARRMGFSSLGALVANYRAKFGDRSDQVFERYFRIGGNGPRDLHLPRGPLTSAKVDLLRHHINRSLGNPLPVAELAALVGMSAQSFALAFKKAFNTTPAQYVMAERLRWAHWLLRHTNASIASVAAETGFSSQSHLTAVSRKLSGETPLEIRKVYYR